MKTLTLAISDDIYAALQQRARMEKKTVEDVVHAWLAAQVTPSRAPFSEAASRAAWDRLRRHAGAASLGYATGADNERIDADVAHEYGNPHEHADGEGKA